MDIVTMPERLASRLLVGISRRVWKARYAKYLKKRLGISYLMAHESAGAALENIDYDLSECPIDSANEEISCWASD